MPPARFPIPQGTLDMLILQVLSLEPAHGYAIAQRLQQISRDRVRANQGSLYPALHRLEQKRWLTSEWRRSDTGRDARFYALTRAGRKQLAAEKASWDRLATTVRLIFDDRAITSFCGPADVRRERGQLTDILQTFGRKTSARPDHRGSGARISRRIDALVLPRAEPARSQKVAAEMVPTLVPSRIARASPYHPPVR